MTETIKHPEMRSTVFGAVFAEMLDAREIPVTPFTVGKLTEDAGLDGWKFINRMASTDPGHIGFLDEVAAKLDLTGPEMDRLARAYTYEERMFLPKDA